MTAEAANARNLATAFPAPAAKASRVLWAVSLQEPAVDLSDSFCGVGVREVTCFLRLIYSPDDAAPESLAMLASKELAAAGALAHKLKAGGLLAKFESYLIGKLPAC